MLEESRALESLVLSTNYLSCNAAALDDSTQLGQGNFPGLAGMVEYIYINVGAVMVQIHLMTYNPFLNQPDYHDSVVLVFAGNSLTTDSSYLPQHEATNLLERDEIKQGQKALFQGTSRA